MGEQGLNIELLDVSDAEILNAPEPAPTPVAEPVVEAAPEPVPPARDQDTGRFVAQAPATMPDPIKVAAPEPVAVKAPEPEPPRVVPLAAHLEERNRWKQEIAERDRRLDEIQQKIKALEPAPAPEPEFIEDPKGYVDGKTGKVSQELAALKQQAEQMAQEQQFTRFTQEIGSQESQFVGSTPDYFEALAYIRDVRSSQLLNLYPDATQEQIQQTLRTEELSAAAQFMQRGRNPAEAVYHMAKTIGYKAKEAAPAAAPLRPEVKRAPVGDPGQTLGSSGGAPSDEVGIEDLGEDDLAPLNEAIAERFGKRR